MPEENNVLRVDKDDCSRVLKRLKREGRLDNRREFKEVGDDILIPVVEGGSETLSAPRYKDEKKTPFERIKERLDPMVNRSEELPDRWEKIGDVVLIKLPEGLEEYKYEIGEAYAETLGAKSVLLQGEIEGQRREPEVELIYGEETETVHVENGVKFKLDVSKIMFSSGNIDERMRMANVVNKGERVIDMFAGIGYFSLPMAVHGGPEVVHPIEINPTAFDYLKQNVRLNGVESIVEPWHGDNEDFPLEDVADRIVMGYLHETWRYLPKAVNILDSEGVIHYHTLAKGDNIFNKVREELENNLQVGFQMVEQREVKSYAPFIHHVVADVYVSS